jgi:hypothetical protein
MAPELVWVVRKWTSRLVQRLVAVRHLPATPRVVQEHEVQVGTVGQLEAAEFAVTDDTESRAAAFAVDLVMRYPMPRREIEPGGFERVVQYRFREKS